MGTTNTQEIFSKAVSYDPTLDVSHINKRKLELKRVLPSSYSRKALFTNMADGKASVFHNFPSPVRFPEPNTVEQSQAVINSFMSSRLKTNVRVKTGKSKTEKYFNVRDMAKMWKRQRAIMNVTDFHYRDTAIEKHINPDTLSEFNLYQNCDESVATQEMMTLVVSSKGGFSDSHSDDSDGSNHSFIGTKLWIAWDTQEGLAAGLEDVEKVDVFTDCKFDIDTWLSLKSACWFTVESGETLFCPGNLTHKVVTLSPYLGVGSFYLSIPNCLRTLSRWILHRANWQTVENTGFSDFLFPDVIQRIEKQIISLKSSPKHLQNSWGLNYLNYSIESWKKQFNAKQRQQIIEEGFTPYDRTLHSKSRVWQNSRQTRWQCGSDCGKQNGDRTSQTPYVESCVDDGSCWST